MNKISTVVLAYSGGLDTSVILKWLQLQYNCEVVTFTADIGQGEELEPARAKASQMGAMANVAKKVRELGMHTFVRWNWVFTVPPLCITDDEMAEGFAIIDEALKEADKGYEA